MEKPEQSNWSLNYKPTICLIMRDRDMGAWTWFSGEPIHIYGIQWLPAWTHMNYFGAHKDHSLFQLNQMLIRQGKDKGEPTRDRIDCDWGQVAAAYAAFSPARRSVAACLTRRLKSIETFSPKHAGIPYYLAHASRVYGLIDLRIPHGSARFRRRLRPGGSRTVRPSTTCRANARGVSVPREGLAQVLVWTG